MFHIHIGIERERGKFPTQVWERPSCGYNFVVKSTAIIIRYSIAVP